MPERPIFVIAPPRSGGRLLAGRLAPVAGGRAIHSEPRFALSVTRASAQYPDASFVYVHRDPRETLGEMLALWRSGQAVTHPELEGWTGPPWSFLLIPRWRELVGRPLPEIVATQWATTMQALIGGLESLAPGRWSVISRAALLEPDSRELRRVARFLGLDAATAPPPRPPGIDLPDDAAAELAPFMPAAAALAAHALDWFAQAA